jgi:hypothetical protein
MKTSKLIEQTLSEQLETAIARHKGRATRLHAMTTTTLPINVGTDSIVVVALPELDSDLKTVLREAYKKEKLVLEDLEARLNSIKIVAESLCY